MREAAASLLGGAAPWLLTYLLHSTALIATAWILERTGAIRRPRSLDALWKAALLGGFLTSGLVVARATAAGPSSARVQAVVQRDGPPSLDGELTWASPEGATRFRAELVEPSPECRALLEGSTPGGDWLRAVRTACLPARLDGRAALAVVWIVGAGALLLLGWRRRRRLDAVLAEAVPAEAWPVDARVATLASELRRGTPRRTPPVVLSRVLPAPCAVRGRIVLPVRCEEEMSDGELRAVLAHEHAHLERRDPAWLALADLVARLAWIQPLNRVAAAGVRDAAELMADQRTLHHARALDLARSIHRVSAWALPGAPLGRLAALTSPREGSLTRRVRRILQGGGAVGSAWPGALLALGLTAAALLLPPVATGRVLHAVVIERVETTPAGAPTTEDATAPLRGDAHRTRVVVRAVAASAPGAVPHPDTP